MDPSRSSYVLTGGEIGFLPGPLSIVGGVYNASDGFGTGTGSNKALLGRVEGMFKAGEGVHLGVGGNVFTKKTGTTTSTFFGGFGSFSYDDLTVIGELDLLENKTAGTKTTGLVSLVEVDVVISPGLDLKAAYNFYDPDKDLKTGSVSKYTFGFEFFPLSGVEVRPLYHIVKEEPTDIKNDEFQLMIHFYL
jgi:hypothetical protein